MMIQKKRLKLAGLILAVVVVLDHTTKWIAIYALNTHGGSVHLIGNYFQFIYAENPGAFLSLGETLPESVRGSILTGLNIAILTGVFSFLALRRYIPLFTIYALSLLLSGGIGNIIDRVLRGGRVVDFMMIDLGMRVGPIPLRTGIFNVADLAIMGGLFLLLGYEMFGPKGIPALEDVTDIEAAKPRTRTP